MEYPKVITICGKRWFDKVNGNTYFSAKIFVDGLEIDVPFQYGYGDYYIQASIEELVKRNILPEEAKYPYTIFCGENGIKLNTTVSDVGRKRDCR